MLPTRVRAAIGLTAAITMLTASVAVADDLLADGDIVSSSATALNLGTACLGDTVTRSVAITVDRAGNGNVYANGASVAISGTAPSGVVVGTSSIPLPADWVTGDQNVDNTKSRAGELAVTLDTSVVRTVSGTLGLAGTGARSGGGTLTRTAAINVSGTVIDCAQADTTPPRITPNVVGTLGDNGWYTSDVTVTWDVVDGESDVTSAPCAAVSITVDQGDTTYTCTATSAGGTASESVTIKRDATAPTITGARTPAANTNGWNNTDVAVAFTCDDAMSGEVSCGPDATVSAEGADQSVSGTAVDAAGNTASTTVSAISIDRTAPVVSLVGGIAAGSYYPHEVDGSSAPTCAATDPLSGLDGTCTTTGSTGFPARDTYTFGATAVDLAGNTGSAPTRDVTVLGYQTRGFFAPVDMSGIVNTVKSGSTVPLKFEVFAGATEMTATSIVTGMKPVLTTCVGDVVDGIEELATGGTSLRYDLSGGQFVYNWQTPKGKAGACYTVTITLLGGQTISARFQLK